MVYKFNVNLINLSLHVQIFYTYIHNIVVFFFFGDTYTKQM
jgi:hypothetical protein